ncbi:MAG: S4 domain-containing protein [Pirellulaceae bacterium]
MTEFVHGPEGLNSALNASAVLFGGEIDHLSDADLMRIFADVPSQELPRGELDGDGFWIVEAFKAAGLVPSSSEARRSIKEGSCYLNNQRVDDVDRKLSVSDLASETVMVLRRGKKKYALLRFV